MTGPAAPDPDTFGHQTQQIKDHEMSEPHSLSALRQAADYLRAEEQHWWADTIMAAIETLTRDDNMAEAIERVRALHQETVYDSFWATDRYCRECSNDWPCPTIQALDGK